MPLFLAQSELSRGGLKLFLSNDLGYSQDGFDVRWTIFSHAGQQVSGKALPAIRKTAGEYYAPWFSDVPNGNYEIEWEYAPASGSNRKCVTQKFFVVDPSSYQCCPNIICNNAYPEAGGQTYLTGSLLGRGDLPLFLKDDADILTDAYAVFWTIIDKRGCPISDRTVASHAAVGEYFADWLVCGRGGDYDIIWEYLEDSDSPLRSKKLPFSILNPAVFIVPCDGCAGGGGYCGSVQSWDLKSNGGSCDCCSSPFQSCIVCPPQPCTFATPFLPVSPPSSSSACCSMEIPRTMHLANDYLPAGGAFTVQPPWSIPHGIRHVTFYVTYTRGTPGGFASFRLMWGNGVEEVRETVFNTDIDVNQPEGVQDLYLQNLDGPAPQTSDPISFTIYTTIPGGVTAVRLLACEKGAVGAVGRVTITLTASD